ncbi:MAG TPA: protealysin inhibitor emfourin [Tahibacter sp.]|nr:protealysin inhibitor emfourin [Tahibacter sp.]
MTPRSVACLFVAAFAAASPVSARDVVHAAMRVREGETIRAEALRLRPAATDDASTFRAMRDVAGRVALADIGEGEPVRRERVGDVPARQFRIGDDTPLRVAYVHATGPVLPNARRSASCTLDTATLPAHDAAALRELVRASGVLVADASAFDILVGGSDDRHLRITVGATTKSLNWSRGHAPASVEPLVRRLDACATAP